MVYVGSKRRMAKHLLPIIQQRIDELQPAAYVEPFVGGCNVIDKVAFGNKVGYDSHPYLIALLKHVQETGGGADLPDTISKEEWQRVRDDPGSYPDWYVGLAGFCASYGGKYFAGYASHHEKNGRDRVNEMIRNLKKQAPSLAGIRLECADFRDIWVPPNSVVYCDPPYRGTTRYKVDPFPYEEFYDWCRERSRYSCVLVSEYSMPDDFKVLWEKDTLTTLCADDNAMKRTEKLFTL